MARTIKTTERITVIEEVAGVVCDGCGMMSPSFIWTMADGSEISTMVASTRHEPDDEFTSTFVDLCPACFDGIIIAALVERGIKVHRDEVENVY